MSNETKLNKRNNKVIRNIKDNYQQLEKSIVEQLHMKHDLHGTTIGSAREDIWRQLFEMIVPKKFVIEQSVFIIDSTGNVSNEVDLAILDETYTPYIFRYGRLKFIPIEAVAAVVECKSQSLKKTTLLNWSKSIKKLKTAENAIARMANTITTEAVPTQKSTRPIRILCALQDEVGEKLTSTFDFILLAPTEKKNGSDRERARITIKHSKDELSDWYASLNFHKTQHNNAVKQAEETLRGITLEQYTIYDTVEHDTGIEQIPISLLSFNFQLNQLLMLINNPILFPHRAYVDMFNGGRKEE